MKLRNITVRNLRLFGDNGQGIRSADFDSSVYGEASVKKQLKKDQKEKCAYCETALCGDYGAVEHYRPKTQWKELDGTTGLGYYWLAYEWDNLLCSCDRCNGQAAKGNYKAADTALAGRRGGGAQTQQPAAHGGGSQTNRQPNKRTQMIKKFMLFAVMAAGMLTAKAQLGEPTITARDTLAIVSCYYRGAELVRADWPDTVVVEDVLNFTVAGFTYKKAALGFTHLNTLSRLYNIHLNWDGHVEIYDYATICNKKNVKLRKFVTHPDCKRYYGDIPYYGAYILGEYEFYVITMPDAQRYRSLKSAEK